MVLCGVAVCGVWRRYRCGASVWLSAGDHRGRSEARPVRLHLRQWTERRHGMVCSFISVRWSCGNITQVQFPARMSKKNRTVKYSLPCLMLLYSGEVHGNSDLYLNRTIYRVLHLSWSSVNLKKLGNSLLTISYSQLPTNCFQFLPTSFINFFLTPTVKE